MAIRTKDLLDQSESKDVEEQVERLLEKIERSFEPEIIHRERAAYWRAVADMQEGRPLRP